jgi:predicted RNA-binding protein with PUA-like domain
MNSAAQPGGAAGAPIYPMATVLLKTEPGEYAFADLVREKRAAWTGVTNNTALMHLRRMREGDEALIYHTGDERAIVGLAAVTGNPYQDPAQPGLNAKGEPRFAVVDIVPCKGAPRPLSLATLKADRRFAGFDLLRLPRLSVMPVPDALDRLIRQMTGLMVLLCACVAAAPIAHAEEAMNAPTPAPPTAPAPVGYTVSLSAPQTQMVDLSIHLTDVHEDTLELALPVWRPGPAVGGLKGARRPTQ